MDCGTRLVHWAAALHPAIARKRGQVNKYRQCKGAGQGDARGASQGADPSACGAPVPGDQATVRVPEGALQGLVMHCLPASRSALMTPAPLARPGSALCWRNGAASPSNKDRASRRFRSHGISHDSLHSGSPQTASTTTRRRTLARTCCRKPQRGMSIGCRQSGAVLY
jgi:hypothetical protein